MAETSDVLRPGSVTTTVYGGPGAFTGSTDSTRVGGAMGRLRVGIGHAQEVGIEGGAYFQGVPGRGNIWGTVKLRWKRRLRVGALVTGAGLTWLDRLSGWGGDIAWVGSTTAFGRRDLHAYGGLRASLMFPPSTSIGGISGAAMLPVGLVWDASADWRIFVETGLVGAGTGAREGWFGGYGALAISYAWWR